MKKRVTVIGNGPLSLSVAAQVSNGGAATVYIDLTKKGFSDLNDYSLKVEGVQEYNTVFDKITTEYHSVSTADVVIIAATASYHQRILDNVIPLLHNDQIVVFFPACFGAINLLKQIRKKKINITVCEAVSFLYVCEQRADDTIYVQAIKNSIKMAVSPRDKAEETISMLNVWFNGLVPAENFLETSLDNMNMVLHPLPILLNISAVEKNEKEFYHYTQGVSSSIGMLMEKMDDERMKIGKALGIKLTSAFEQLKEYYGDRELNSMTEYISSEKGPYPLVKGFGLNSRYITEDVPYLLVAAKNIARFYSVETPVMDMTIRLASMIMKTDYDLIGYDFGDLSDIIGD